MKRVLIANRGAISVRVGRTLKFRGRGRLTGMKAKAMGELGGNCALSRALVDLLPRLEPIVLGVGRTVFTYI